MNVRSPNQALFLLLFAVVVQRSEQCLRNNNMAQEALIRPYNDPYSNGGNRFLQQQQQQFQDQQFQQQPQQQFQNQQSQQQQSSSNQQNQAQSSQQQALSQQQPMDQTQVDAVDQADNQRLPLPECFLGVSRMVCCNRQLEQTLLSQAANSLRRFTRQTFVSTNNTALENFSTAIANRVQSVFGESFEVIVATGNFASRIHFFSNLLCKVQIYDGYYVLVYATPKPELEPYATAGPLQENGYLNSLHRTWTMAEPTYQAATQPPSDVAVMNEDQLWPWPHNAPGTMTASFPELGRSVLTDSDYLTHYVTRNPYHVTQPPQNEHQLWPWPHNAPAAMTTPSEPEGVVTLTTPRKRNITMSHHRIWYQRLWYDML